MAADSANIVDQMEQLREEFRALSELVSGPDSAMFTASDMELRIFRELLGMGRRLLELFFVARAASRLQTPLSPDGTPYTEWHLRPKTYLSVFGKVRFLRQRFFASGQPGFSPLDEALSLPERCYSPLLRDWAGHEVVDAAFEASARTMGRILGLELPKSALETLVMEDAVDVDAFYDQKPVPEVTEEGPILVVQADGAGVRLVDTEPSERTGHKTSKREALLTSHYTVQRYVRTPQAMAEALLGDTDTKPRSVLTIQRPRPVGKETRATLDGKDAALARLRARVLARDGPHIQDRAALTDGDEALQKRLAVALPDFTLVLDILHVLGYLWAAAQAAHGGWASPACHTYVRRQLEALLSGQTQAVIDDLSARLEALPEYRRRPVIDAIRYFSNHAAYMRYDQYLARGWPIASGVIEGACKHVVRDRMERSGMRWTCRGAGAMLQLRTTRINGDWDAYQRFHHQREHLRLYGRPGTSGLPEVQALAQAA